jgi:hypothetical protein
MLTMTQVCEIKERLVAGEPQLHIAQVFGVSRSLISDIATGRAHEKVGPLVPRKNAGGQGIKYDPTNARIVELEEEIVHLTDERNRANARVKAGAKVGGLFHAIVKEMDTRIKPMTVLPSTWTPVKKGQIVEHCVLHISDCHADQVVHPESVGGLEEFNFPIACARAERLIDSTLDWTQSTLAPKFRFPVLWVLVYGDLTSGTIHKAAERSYYRNQFKNCLAIGQLHGLMIRDLASRFEKVNVVCVSGNHGRTTEKKDYGGPTENFDYLVAEIARLYCRELKNTSFLIPDSWSVTLDINGVGMQVSHGDEVRSNGGIPFYGMVRRQKGLIALNSMQGGLRTRYFAMGHHHVNASLADVDGELLVNGSWVGTDPFAFNALAGYREPTQLLHGMNAKYGVTWRLPVKLKHSDEKRGPKRYMIDGGRDVGPLL